MDFAKLFRLKNKEQVLVTIDYDDEEDAYKVNMHAEIDSVRITLGMGYHDEDTARRCFNDFSQNQAEAFYEQSLSVLNE